mmetsp:Transcript_57650/g.100907  ORF Transcript_57650/g.100907 Transcript_57650/m.100907 type:complete len:803 (-) Transcript_57650:98-2506(-)
MAFSAVAANPLLLLVALCLLACPWRSFAQQEQCRRQLPDLLKRTSSSELSKHAVLSTLCWDKNPGTVLLQTVASVSKRPSRLNTSRIEGNVAPSSENSHKPKASLNESSRKISASKPKGAQSNGTGNSVALVENELPNATVLSEALHEEKAHVKEQFHKFMDAFRMADRLKEAKLLHSFEPLLRPLERGLQGATIVLLIFITMMFVLPGNSGLRTLIFIQSDTDDKTLANSNALRVMDEHQMRKPEAGRMTPLQTIPLNSSVAGFWYYFPLTVTMLSIAIPMALIYSGWGYLGMSFPVSFVVYVSWKLGLHVALCSCVGIKKMRIYEKADFGVMYRQEQAHPIPERGPRWDDVMHFVLIVNYKEDMETLTQAIGSVAASPLAKVQIGLVLAMEEREEGAQDKALKLQKEFADKFRHIFATFHPADLPGEVPGKPSNTNWAGQILFNQFMPEHGIDLKRTVVTVMDADSEFHPQYFNALTYSFVHAGGEEDETPDRYLTIWQPPILHYKNYLRQPALVRLASWVSSEHELANLADPYCTKLPYSTYSISAELAKKVNGWDPDWISEDQHMALKCFLATGGRSQVQPIFLAVLNYAPECDSLIETLNARWAQAKRHALGYGEVVYMLDKFGAALNQVSGVQARLQFIWRSFWLFLKMLTIHLFFATSFLIGPLTGSFVFYFYRHLVARALLPVYCVFQMVQTISLNWGIVVSVLVYVKVKDRVEGSDSPKFQFRNNCVHCLSGFVQYNCLLPFLWCFGACAEWIASIKLTQTHRFDHEVAAKPTSLAEKIQQESAEDAQESAEK